MNVSIFFLLALGLLMATRAEAQAPQSPPQSARVVRDLAYVPGASQRQMLDLHLPARADDAPIPLVVYIHGGAFLSGDKNSDLMPARLLSQGYAIASLNYRLSDEAKFPAQIEDCKAAVRWLRAHAGEYNLDANRLVAWGESAGGHLVAILGTTGQTKTFDVGENLEFSSAVQGVVDLYGPTDFLQMDAHRIEGGDSHDAADSPASRLIGGAIQEHKSEVERANPILYISPQTPPFVIVHGTKDRVVPFHQSQILAAALAGAGIAVNFLPIEGADHGFSGANEAQSHQIDAATDKFLLNLFAGKR